MSDEMAGAAEAFQKGYDEGYYDGYKKGIDLSLTLMGSLFNKKIQEIRDELKKGFK